jgi:DUF4097 and DUF4098 domain-containing protein YvlB
MAWVLLAVAARADAAADRQMRTLPLPPGSAITVDITIGSVRIEGADRADVEIAVERQAPTIDALARIPAIIVPTPAGVTVRALQADGGMDAALRADVVLRVPATAVFDRVRVAEGRLTVEQFRGSIAAEVRRGPIDANDVAGTLRLETSIGSIAVKNARLVAGGLIRLRAFNGNVRLHLAARPSDARILALALNGAIASTIPLTRRDTWGPRWSEATLGKGEPVISIDVVTGRIEIESP